LAEKESVTGGFGKPALMVGRLQGATLTIRNIGDAVYVLDISIKKWIELLNRAQPHRNGRLTLIFSSSKTSAVEGELIYNVDPIVGKMVLMKSGTWKFFKLTKKNVYTKLSDLRVGKTLPSDPLVIRLIDGIEDMLKQREFLVEVVVSLRTGVPGKVASVQAASARRHDEALDLEDRIKLDWSLGADLAERTIQEHRRARGIAYRASKLAKLEAAA